MPPELQKSELFEDYSRIEALVNAHNDQLAKQKEEEVALALKKRVSEIDDKPVIAPVAGPLALAQPIIPFNRRREDSAPLLPYTTMDSELKQPKRTSLVRRLKSKGSYYLANSKRALRIGKKKLVGGEGRRRHILPVAYSSTRMCPIRRQRIY